MVDDRCCGVFRPAPTFPSAGTDRICFGIWLSCFGLFTGAGTCTTGAFRRAGPALLPCSAHTEDEDENIANAANLALCFVRCNPSSSVAVAPFLSRFHRFGAATGR